MTGIGIPLKRKIVYRTNYDKYTPDEACGDVINSYTNKTNLQVEGVDEVDIIKNDNWYIYFASSNYGLRIIDTYSNVVYNYPINDFEITEMYLANNCLVVYRHYFSYANIKKEDNIFETNAKQYFDVKVLNIEDHSNITEIHDIKVNKSLLRQAELVIIFILY